MAETRASALAGKRVVITRPAAQSEALARELSERGAIAIVLPLVSFADPEDFEPLDRAIAEIEQFDWMILTSAQAVRAMTHRAADLQLPLVRANQHPRVACVGPVTAEAARKANLPVEYIARTHSGVALANELATRLQGAKILLPRSDRANPDLPEALERHNAQVTEVVAYRTLRPAEVNQDGLKKLANGEADAVLFFSPSAVHHFAEIFGAEKLSALQDKLALAAVGPVTANALQEAGVLRAVVAADTTAASVMETLEQHFNSAGKAAPAGVRRG